MNTFDERWKACIAQARRATDPKETAPFGFASRVLSAVAGQDSSQVVSLELIWQRLTLGSLGLVASLLIICAILELPHLRDRRPLDPGIENTVAQLVWGL
jgi:hypothetical protein